MRYVGKGYTVYVHTNLVNGKRYIGQTRCTDLTRRWTGGHGYEGCPYFYSAILKYGWNGFAHEILKTGIATQEEADYWERYYIKEFDTMSPEHGYNIKSGGHHAGEKTEENKRKHLERITGANNPLARKISVYDLQGKRVAVFDTVSATAKFLGVRHSTVSSACGERRDGTCAGYILRYFEDAGDIDQLPDSMIRSVRDMRKKFKTVGQYDLDGNLLCVFESSRKASEVTGTKATDIASCLSNKCKQITANGFIWERHEEYPQKVKPYRERIEESGYAKMLPKKVGAYSRETGELIITFDSAKEAGMFVGHATAVVARWCKGTQPKDNPYEWRYID